MRMPGIGLALLREVQNITRSHTVAPPGVPSPKFDEADLRRLQRDIQVLLGRISAPWRVLLGYRDFISYRA